MRRYECGSVAAWTEPAGAHDAVRAADLAAGDGNPAVATLSAADADAREIAAQGTSVAWVDATTTPHVLRLAILDKVGPFTYLRVRPVQKVQPTPVVWSAQDDWSKVTGFDVHESVIRWDATEWTSRRLFTNTMQRSWAGPYRPGRTYCYRARARDEVGNIGDWSNHLWEEYSSRCTVIPIDDRRLGRTGDWSAREGSRYFQGTYLRTRRQNATLVRRNVIGIRRFGVLVATGPGNGRIRLSFSDFSPRVIDLDTPTRQWLVVRGMTAWESPGSSGRLTVTVLSQGKPVRIDGVYVGKR